MSPEQVVTDVDGRHLTLSNLTKVLYPAVGFTKGEVLNYYARVADVMVPHLEGRPVTLKRFPDGVDAESFFEKHAPAHTPEWVPRAVVPRGFSSRSKSGATIEYVMVADRPTLIWAANLASLEFHVPMWRVGDGKKLPKNPDLMVFDLDPGPGTTIVECCQVAQWVSERVGADHVFAKTSGSKGLQLYMRLDGVTNEQATEQAHEHARAIEQDHPDQVVSNMKKELRKNKVLIDWSQNTPAKTTVAVYSLRARPEPTVSTPVTWSEVRDCARSGEANRLSFKATKVLDRIDQLGDLFGGLLPD